MAMMWTTGPAFIWLSVNPILVSIGPTGLNELPTQPSNYLTAIRSAVFLGTCETPPKIEVIIGQKDVKNDIGGSEIPFDSLYLGRMARTTAIINRPNMSVILAAQAASPIIPNPGFDYFGDIGSLTVQEGYCYTVWVVFPYSNPAVKTAMAGQPWGYRFPFSTLEDEVMDGLGTDARRWPFVWKHLRGFTPCNPGFQTPNVVSALAGVTLPTNSFLLYDFNVAGLPNNGLNIS